SRWESGQLDLTPDESAKLEEALLSRRPRLASLLRTGELLPAAPPPNNESRRLTKQVVILEEQLRVVRDIANSQQTLLAEFAEFCKEFMQASDTKDVRIDHLAKKLAEVREFYTLGTTIAVGSARFEELREKLELGRTKGKE